jgi:acyl carrier protein
MNAGYTNDNRGARRVAPASLRPTAMEHGSSPTTTLEDRLLDLVAEESDTPRETLDRETRLIEIGDSLTRVETVMTLEDEFEISLPDDQVDTVRTLGDLIDLVSTAVRQRENPASDGAAPPSP